MAKDYNEYLELDDNFIKSVKCMLGCGTEIAKRVERNGEYKLIHMTHSKRYPVRLKDLSYANLLVCKTCYNKLTDKDLSKLQKTQRWGWQQEQDWKVKPKKAKLSVLKKLFKNKDIIKRGI